MTRGFTDIHHHLLYGVDDGAQTLKSAYKMAEAAWRKGTKTVIATPHVSPGISSFSRELFEERLGELQKACGKNSVDLRILLGAEILYTDGTGEYLQQRRIPTLAGSDYVLVEFVPNVSYDEVRSALIRILRAGNIPVVAHVERYASLVFAPRRMKALKRELGDVLFQMNASTVLGGKGFFGDLCAKRMLDAGLVDIIASDAHNLSSRPTRMLEAFEILKKRYGGAHAARMTGLDTKGEFWQTILGGE